MPRHNALTGSNLHEPKGIGELAEAGKVYTSDGAGSGSWQSSGGSVFGEMMVANNSIPQSLTAATDTTLNTDSEYAKLDSGIWVSGPVCPCGNVSFDASGYLQTGVAGLYEVSFWASFSISAIGTLLGIKFSSDDTNTSLSQRKTSRLSGAGGDVGSIAGSSFAVLGVGDKMSLWAAADGSVDITLIDAGVTLTLLNEGYTAP